MKSYVLDSYAVLAFLKKERNWEKVQNILFMAIEEKAILYISAVNYGEIFYTSLRTEGAVKTDSIMAAVDTLPINIISADRQMAMVAGEYKSRGGISYADCFAAALAKLNTAVVITGDKEFKEVEDDVNIFWI